MNNKITFKDAVQISIDLNRIFKNLDYPKEISAYDVKALWFLKESGTNNLNEIKEVILNRHEHLDKQRLNVRISKIVKHLESALLIKKTKDDNDKREVIIIITKKGNELLKNVCKRAEKLWKDSYEK